MRKLNRPSVWKHAARFTLLLFLFFTIDTIYPDFFAHPDYNSTSMFTSHSLVSWFHYGTEETYNRDTGISFPIHYFLRYFLLIGLPMDVLDSVQDFILDLPAVIPGIPGYALLLGQLIVFLLSFKRPGQAFRAGFLLYAIDTVIMVMFYYLPYFYTGINAYERRFLLLDVIIRLAMVGVLFWAGYKTPLESTPKRR